MAVGYMNVERTKIKAGSQIVIDFYLFDNYDKGLFWRVSEDSDISLIKGKSKGHIVFPGPVSITLTIKTSKKLGGGSARIGIEASTDRTFSDPTLSLTGSSNPRYVNVYSSFKNDAITGSWQDGDDPRFTGDMRDTLILYAENGGSKYGRYFLRMDYSNAEQTSFGGIVKKGSIYAETNYNYELDKKDKLITRLKNINYYYHPGPSQKEGPWRIDKKEGVITLWRGGNRTFEASIDADLF